MRRFVDLVDCTHALSSHPLMMHLPGEIELDESTDARRVVLARSSRAATSRGNGSRGGVSRSIVRMVRDHARRITRATFSKPHHPDWVSLEAPPSTRKNRPPRTPLKPTFQNDKSLIDTQSASLCPSVQSLPNVSYRCATRQAAQGQGRSRFALRAQPPGRRDDRARGGQLGLVRRVLRPHCDRERPKQDHFSPFPQLPPQAPSVAKSDGHFSVPHNQKVRAAATARIATALPRRVSSCVDLPALFFAVRFHFAASLRQAHGASPPRRKRSRRPSCLRSQPRGYHHRHRINDQQCGWGGSARLIWPCCSVCVSHQRDVPKGTVVLRSVRDETDIDVTAHPRSSALK